MSDETKEIGTTSTETPAQPKPEFSSEETPSSPGNLDEIANALIEKLSPQVIEIARKASQSGKDSGIAKAQKNANKALEGVESMRGVVEKFQAYVATYGSEERAYVEMERDARLSKLESSNSGQEPVGAGSKSWEIEQKEILESVGLSLSDQRVLDLARSKKWSNEREYLDALKANTFDWFQGEANKPEPSAGTTGTTVNGTTGSQGDFPDLSSEQLGDRMVSLMAERTKNAPEIEKIEAELRRRDTIA